MEQKERKSMRAPGHTQKPVDKGMIIIALVLLLGIALLAIGFFSGNKIAFYVGILITLAGVLTGIQRLIVHSQF